jgi:hypothetical protein
MITHRVTGEQFTETRKELADRYFGDAYPNGNMDIISLLSDTQEIIAMHIIDDSVAEHYRKILNDIKMILMRDDETNQSKKEN